MSWSMFSFGSHWAHAHDIEQINFMALASEFVEGSEKYRRTPWLQEWRAYWLEHMGNHGNGCSDLNAEAFLVEEARTEQFVVLLGEYAAWLRAFGEAIPTDRINKLLKPSGTKYQSPVEVKAQLRFLETVRAVMKGDESNPSVHRLRQSDA